ncbi:MAG TPA: ATP-dependent DNA helicase [Polyangiaceae bacterium]|jgi:ATP-dependent DNA helicase DinG
MATAAELLGPHGPLASALPGYEAREAQLAMASAVERTLMTDRVLLCEAGTGTGKTLAYLVPAMLSGKKVVISTATRALQEQIFWKDLPLIEKALGLRSRVALMKGISNYVCRRRLSEFRASPESLRPMHARSLKMLDDWLGETDSGDLGELAGLPEDSPLRAHVSSSSETRVGQGCQYYSECFVTGMREQAERAEIVIVNHHLFFADLALRGPHPGRVLPDYDAVIFDEAHQLEDIATDFFGIRVSRSRIDRMLRDAERTLLLAGSGDALLQGAPPSVGLAGSAAAGFWATLGTSHGAGESRVTIERDAWTGALEARYHELDGALEGVAAAAKVAAGRLLQPGVSRPVNAGALTDALSVVAERAELVRNELAAIVAGGPGRISWLEFGARSAALSSTPIDLSHVLRARIFESVPAVVLTSATLSSAPKAQERSPFSYLRARVGLAGDEIEVTELLLESPFDFERRALLYTPRDLPAPNEPAFVSDATQRILELIEITGGGCFVLTTSLRSMQAFYKLIVQRLPGHRVLVQGSAPKAALLGAFRASGDAVLVATMSFWEGVDIPGRALRLVVLEKIPFLVPSDPIVQARGRELERAGLNPFMELHVPAAAITLKQGFGRLIRSHEDCGIVALLDPRIYQKSYGKRVLAALPPAERTSELERVRSFWAALHGAPQAAIDKRAPTLVD